jgi:putative serine protease PepD
MADNAYRPYPPTAPLPPPAPPLPTGNGRRRAGGRVVAAAVLAAAITGAAAGFGAATVGDDGSTAASSTVTGDSDLHFSGSTNEDDEAAQGSIEAAAAAALPSVVKIYASSGVSSGTGSGVILTEDGEILTNNHVVEVATQGGDLAVSFNDGSTAAASVVGTDPLTDLAVIKAEGVSGLTPATLGDSDQLDVGEEVVALGAPYGLESTVTTGIVSALNRPVSTSGTSSGQATVFPAIQTDAAINPGNSGGPLINLAGEVVGIDSAIRTDSSSVDSQGGSIGLGFAIPINDAVPIVEELRNGETATHARIGIGVDDATDELGLPGGAVVGDISAGSAAAEADLEPGQVITAVDNHDITDAQTLIAIVRTYRPGDTVTLTVAPNGSSDDTREVKLTLGSDVE